MDRLRPFPGAPCRWRCLWIAALPLIGCRAPEPAAPFEAPQLLASLRYFRGSPLSGPQASADKLDTGDLCPFRIEALALEDWKPELIGGQAIGSQARLLAMPLGGSPVKPLPRLTSATRILDASGEKGALARLESGQLGRTALIASRLRGALPSGVTAVYELKPPAQESGLAEVHMYRRSGSSGDQITVALILQGRSAIEEDQDPGDPAGVTAATQRKGPPEREIALLDSVPAGEARSTALFLPEPFEGQSGKAIVFVISTGPSGPHDAAGAVAQDPEVAQALAILSQASISPAAADPEPASTFAAGLPPAFEAIASPPTRKNALLLLASESGASMTEDFALTCEFDQLNSYCELLLRKAAATEKPLDAAKLAFLLEAACVEHLSALLSKEKLPGELQAVLLKHAGQAGRQASALEDALKSSRSIEALRSRLAEENWVALEDNSPPARVRAYDWLLARGEAPPGFDPLAAAKERRKALEKAQQARAELASTPAATPAAAPESPKK